MRTLILRREQEEWDKLLPQLMRAYEATLHSTTGKTANPLMLGKELRLRDQLQDYTLLNQSESLHEYVISTKGRSDQVHEDLQQRQIKIRQEDHERLPLHVIEDIVWLEHKGRKKRAKANFQPKFVGPYQVKKVHANHTCGIKKQGKLSIQNQCRLKLYHPCSEEMGQAPATLEPRRRLICQG